MNRGTINGYAINDRGVRGGAIRVAADLIGEAYIVASAHVYRYLTGPMSAVAEIGPIVGRRWARSPVSAVAEAVITAVSVPRIRDAFNAVCEAVIELGAKVTRRVLVTFDPTADVDLSAYALLRAAAQFEASADIGGDFTSWRISPEVFTGQAQIALTAGVLNEFPYDEDAPEERVFIVPPEDNVFYVVV